jgi:hypothetical protein
VAGPCSWPVTGLSVPGVESLVGGTQFALPSLPRRGDLGGRSHTQAARRLPRKQPAVSCSASPLALALPHVLRHAYRLREPPPPCRPSSRASTASGLPSRAATSAWTFGTAPFALCRLLALAGQHPGHHHSLRVQLNPRRAGASYAPIVLQPPPGPRFPAETGSLFCTDPNFLEPEEFQEQLRFFGVFVFR